MLCDHNLASIRTIVDRSIALPQGCPEKFELQRLLLAGAICTATDGVLEGMTPAKAMLWAEHIGQSAG